MRKKITLCCIAVALGAFAFSFATAPDMFGDTSPPVTSDQIVRAVPLLPQQPALATIVPLYQYLLAQQLQALPAERWRDLISIAALALAACAYVAKRYRSFGGWIRYLKEIAQERWQWMLAVRLRLKLVALSLAAFFVGGLREQFCTANAKKTDPTAGPLPDEKPPAADSEVGLLCKGAGVDWKDVTWRIRAGLSAKQAVEVALNEKREAAGEPVNELSEAEKTRIAKGESIAGDKEPAAGDKAVNLDNKTVAQLKKIAAARKVELTADMKKADIIAAIEGAE